MGEDRVRVEEGGSGAGEEGPRLQHADGTVDFILTFDPIAQQLQSERARS